jgi:hypothetical protein
MKDVATAARVSLKTVSRVVNGEPGVTPSTEQRVRVAIEALGFRRNDSARLLRTGQAETVGLVLEDIGDPFYSALAPRRGERCPRPRVAASERVQRRRPRHRTHARPHLVRAPRRRAHHRPDQQRSRFPPSATHRISTGHSDQSIAEAGRKLGMAIVDDTPAGA